MLSKIYIGPAKSGERARGFSFAVFGNSLTRTNPVPWYVRNYGVLLRLRRRRARLAGTQFEEGELTSGQKVHRSYTRYRNSSLLWQWDLETEPFLE